MAGTKRLLANGKWELCASLGTNLKGKRIRKYKYVEASGPREADKLLAEFVAECNRSGYSEGERMLIRDYAPLWKKDYAQDQLRKKTVSRYGSLIERVVEYLGHLRLCDIVNEPTYLLQFYKLLQEDGVRKDRVKKNGKLVKKEGGLSLKTIRHHHALLSSMFQSAVDWNLIKENPCTRVKPPREKKLEKKKKQKKQKNYFTIDQAKSFLRALDELPENKLKYKVMVFLAISTGFRRGEIMGLEWSDIDFETNCVSVERTSLYTAEDGIFEDETKTDSSERTVVIPESIVEILIEYKTWWKKEKKKAKDKWNETDRLFVQWNGEPMHPDTISQWFPKFIRKNNLPRITYHGLRHTYGSILLAMGMDLESVAAVLGHENIQMLIQTYGHNVKKEANQEAAKIIDATLFQKEESASAIEPESPENKPTEIKASETISLPESIPEDIRLLIEKLIVTYTSSSQYTESGGVNGGVSKK